MEDAQIEGQEILSKFLCPFNCDSTLSNNGCPFGHRPPPESKQFEHLLLLDPSYKCPLKPLPAYCCASYLALKCSKREYSFQCGAHSSAEILTRCEDGFHMELSEVDDLQLFAQKMAKVLLGASEICNSDSKFVGLVPFRNRIDIQIPPNYISAGHKRSRHELAEDDDDKDYYAENSCAICFDQLTNNRSLFGHLENCTHVFCAKCIHKWQNRGANKGCPVCRKRITKILVWPKLLKTQAKKKRLFDLISGEVPSNERVHREMTKSRLEYFATQSGEMMQAKLMDLKSMKMFLKNPRPNWHCYVLQKMAIVGRHSNRIIRTHYRRARSRVTNAAGRNSEDNVAANQNRVVRSTMEQRPMSIPVNVAENNVSSNANTNQTTESNISLLRNPNNVNITANTVLAIRNLNNNRTTFEPRPSSSFINISTNNVATNSNDNQINEINIARVRNPNNNNNNRKNASTNTSSDFDLFDIRQRFNSIASNQTTKRNIFQLCYPNLNTSNNAPVSVVNDNQNNITASLNRYNNISTFENLPNSDTINVSTNNFTPNTNDNQSTEISISSMHNSNNNNVAISVNNANHVGTNNSTEMFDFDLFGIRQRAQANQFNSC